MVKFTITGKQYVLKIRNYLTSEIPYDVSCIDSSIPPGNVPPNSNIEIVFQPTSTPFVHPCVQLLTLPYNYNRPVFVEFSKDKTQSIQNIDLTEMPGFVMVENGDSIDRIMEVGYNVQLSGENTSDICIDVFFML